MLLFRGIPTGGPQRGKATIHRTTEFADASCEGVLVFNWEFDPLKRILTKILQQRWTKNWVIMPFPLSELINIASLLLEWVSGTVTAWWVETLRD